MLMGREFQICGAEILKPRDPNDKLCLGILPADENVPAERKHLAG